MKVIASAFLITLLAALGSAQDSNPYTNWVGFETPGNVISVSMPKDYLVNVEKIEDGEKKIIYSFANGVMMEFSYYRSEDAKSNLSRIYVEATKNPMIMDFAIDKLAGKQIAYIDSGYRYKLFLASSDMYYLFEVSAASKDQKEIALFLQSIKINGKQFVKSDKNFDGLLTERISTKSLKSSEQVIDLLKRKTGKHAGAVTYEPLAAFRDCKEDLNLRPAILLTTIHPDFSGSFGDAAKGGELKIKMMLSADGQVGDIVIYSDADRRVLKTLAESARKAKFIPAERNGMPTDTCKVEWRSFGTQTSIFSIR
jgi:hypothetical protein